MQRLAVRLLMLLLLTLPAFAQRSYVNITRAQYGSGDQWVDVTDRVRSLFADSPRFLVTDQALGIYSQPSETKTLRIDVTDESGNSRQISFRQNEYADLAGDRRDYEDRRSNGDVYGQDQARRGYPRGDLQITSARYGSGRRTIDVTNILNSRVRGGRLEMTVGSTALGNDPAPNRDKVLTVHYTYNGREEQAVARDGETLRLPQRGSAEERGYGQGPYRTGSLEVTRAQYGSWNHSADVTQQLNSQITDGQLHLQVTSAALGGDPSPGESKTLRVEYMVNGQRQTAVAREGETLDLPQGTQGAYYPGRNTNPASQTVVCEASGDDRRYCAADTRGGVTLVRQISGTSCRQGSNWGYDSRGIWVSNGCRAEFAVASGYASNPNGYGRTITIPSGTQLTIRTNETIDSSRAQRGQQFSGVTTEDVRDNVGNTVIPRGSDVELVIRNTEASDLVLDVDSISVGGQQYAVSTADLEKKGGTGIGANRRTATMVGGGALAGAVIGAIAGGGKGAAIGAAVGGAAGAGAQVLTRGKEVKVPAETVLTFQLDSDLQLQERTNQY